MIKASLPSAREFEINSSTNDAALARSEDTFEMDFDTPKNVEERKDRLTTENEKRPVSAPAHNNGIMTGKTRINETTADLKTAPGKRDIENVDKIPTTSNSSNDRDRSPPTIRKAPATAPPKPSNGGAPTRRLLLETAFDRDGKMGGGLRKASKLLFTAGDCCVKPIVCSDDIEDIVLPHVQLESLPFPPVSPEQLLSCDTEVLEKHLKDIYVTLKRVDLDWREQLMVLSHLFSCCHHAKLANVIVNSSILSLLTKKLHLGTSDASPLHDSSKSVVAMTCLILGVLFRFATFFAPSSTDQVHSLVETLADIGVFQNDDVSHHTLDPRRQAVACLGELLFYMSTQREREVPMVGWDRISATLDNDDLVLRHYAARTLCNTLTNCQEGLIPTLISEPHVSTLLRNIMEYSEVASDPSRLQLVIGVWVTTTQFLAQVFRYLRSPSMKKILPSKQRSSLLMLCAKRNAIRGLWKGFQTGVASEVADLAISSLNVLNAFVEIKLDGCRDSDRETIELSREDLLERVVTFTEFSTVLGKRANIMDASRGSRLKGELNVDGKLDEDETSLLRAKLILLLYLGVQSNRSFIARCLQAQVFRQVESCFAPLVAIVESELLESNSISDTSSFQSKPSPSSSASTATTSLQRTMDSMSPANTYLLQCQLNLIKMSVRTALKIAAECISSTERSSDSLSKQVTITAVPFQLLEALLNNHTCRVQLLEYFVANENKQYTFFLRLMAKMLAIFPEHSLESISDGISVGVYLSKILLLLFQCAADEASDIVLVEQESLYLSLLPALADQITRDSTSSTRSQADSAELSVASIRVIYLVLLQFELDPVSVDTEQQHRAQFIRGCLLPRLCVLLTGGHHVNENVWRFAIELLFGLISSDISLLTTGDNTDEVADMIIQLLATPRQHGYHSLPSSATKLVKMLTGNASVKVDKLYELNIVDRLLSGLSFAAGEALGGCVMDLLEVLLELLHHRYEALRQHNRAAQNHPPNFEKWLQCASLMVQLCGVREPTPSPSRAKSEAADERQSGLDTAAGEHGAVIADVASRCLIFLSQVTTKSIAYCSSQTHMRVVR